MILIRPGYPIQQTFYHFHPDEETLIRAALVLESSCAPPMTAYGLLPLYMLRGALAFTGVLPGVPALDMGSVQGQVWIYMTARLLAAALSCMSLLLVCWLGRRCFGEWAALLATFFTAVAPVVVQQAHFFTVDGVFLLCSLVCFCVLAKALEKEEWGGRVRRRRCV